MFLLTIAYVLSGLIGLGIIFIGGRFLIAPRIAATGYGVPIDQQTGKEDAYLAVKGVRDIASGIFVFILIAAGAPHVLGWFLLAATLIPIGDAIIVLTHQGAKVTAYGVHGVTAAVMVVVASLLLSVTR
jgi:Domain of unknown function (DUF4267)